MEDHLSDYSENFEEEFEAEARAAARPPAAVETVTPRNAKSHPTGGKRTGSKTTSWKLSGTSKTRSFSYTKHLSKMSKLTPQRWYNQGKSPSGLSPRDRVLSAKRHTIKALQNELADSKRELDELRKENRLLNRLQVRQERELNRFVTQEGELPQILIRHGEEVRALKEQLRRSQDNSSSYHQKMNELRQELLRLTDRKKKLEGVVRRRNLLERETLTLQLQEANEKMEGKDKRITDLERGLAVMTRNHTQELKTLLHKNRALTHEMDGLKDTSQRMHAQLKEKEKEMDVMNIYSQRIVRHFPRNSPRVHAPFTESSESQTDFSCPPFKNVSLQTKAHLKTTSSQTELATHYKPTNSKKLVPTGTQTEIKMSPRGSSQEDIQRPSESETVMSAVSRPTEQSTSNRTSPEKTSPRAFTTAAIKPDNEGGKPMDEERQKKDLLLAKLRAMDGQKAPPSSQPVAVAALVKTAAEPTANITVGTGRISEAAPRTKATATVNTDSKPTTQSATEADDEAQRKKQLLLARLMAIDEDNSHKESPPKKGSSSRKPAPRHVEGPGSATRSNTSLQSWSDTVQNMHNGKPAFSSEEDPKHSAKKQRGSGSVKKAEAPVSITESETGQLTKGLGRRAEKMPGKTKNGSVFGGLNPEEGLRDTKSSELAQPVSHTSGTGRPRDYPWENRVDIGSITRPGYHTTTSTSASPGLHSGSGSGSKTSTKKDSLLPRKPKADPATSSFDVVPGAMGEPEDIEELVL